MKQYLLDTNVLGAYLQGRPGALSLAQAWIHIAATALHYKLTLVTTDSDFTRVPDLSLLHLPVHSLRG
jgi:predicted nucleic acid-binding protein